MAISLTAPCRSCPNSTTMARPSPVRRKTLSCPIPLSEITSPWMCYVSVIDCFPQALSYFLPTFIVHVKFFDTASRVTDNHKVRLSYLILFSFLVQPQITLTIGANDEKDRRNVVREGTNVYFLCNILANPHVSEVAWLFQDHALFSNPSTGMLVNNQSLVIRGVRREHRGRYRCVATNAQGTTKSTNIDLKVHCKCCLFAHWFVYLLFANIWISEFYFLNSRFEIFQFHSKRTTLVCIEMFSKFILSNPVYSQVLNSKGLLQQFSSMFLQILVKNYKFFLVKLCIFWKFQ